MYNPNFLTLSRHHVYYFRFPIPQRLHPQGKRTDIKLSLDTRCPREALQLARALSYAGNELIQRREIYQMDYQEIRDALFEHFKSMRERTKERIAKQGMLSAVDVKSLHNSQASAIEALANSDYSRVGTDVELSEFIDDYGLPIKRDSDDHTTLRTEFVKAFRDYCGSVLEYNSRFDGFNFKTDPASLAIHKNFKKANKHKLADAFALYMEERIKAKKWKGNSPKENAAKFQLLLKYLGEDASLSVSSDTAADVKRMLYKLPARYNVIPALQVLSIEDALKQEGYETLKAPTISKYLSTYSTFYEWAVKRKMTDENNFLALIDSVTDAHDERDPFTLEQSRLIIKHALKEEKPHFKWGALIAFYTGARLNEIAQLEGADIVQEGNIWLFDINANGEYKRLKNKASKRIIPIHSRLIDLGFLDFVKQQGQGHLFPALPYQQKGGYGRNLGRWFNDNLLHQLELKKPSLVFHSTRHTVAEQLRNNSVELSKIQSVLGHAHEGVTLNTYAKNVKASILHEAIETLSYA
jgi:integrase